MANATTRRPMREITAKPRNDVYTGLLLISFIALFISSILLYLDYSQYGDSKAPKPSQAAVGTSPTLPSPAGDGLTPPAPMGDAPMPMPGANP